VGAWFALRPEPLPVKPVVPPPIAVVDAGAAAVPDAAVAAKPDAGPAAQPDAGTEIDAGAAVAPLVPVAAKNGRLELRIRPYATVYLDDRKLGDTPLPAINVPVGKHKLRLVNPAFGKDVELNIVIHPGENVVKHNLKE
jgi:serine/threonine-protein kinase